MTKIAPNLRFPEFTDEWRVKKLGDVADVSKLAGFEFTNYIKYSDVGKIIGLRGLNIKSGKLDLSDVKYIDESDLSKLNRSKLYIGDIIFTYVGTVGETAVIDENDRYYLAPNVSRIRVQKNETNGAFIGSLISSERFQKNVIAKYISSSSQPALSMENIRKFIMIVPSKSEQEKIADFFTAVDGRISVSERRLEQLQRYKRGVMQKIFSQQVRFKDVNGKDYPDWEEKKLRTILDEGSKTPVDDTSKYQKITVSLNKGGVRKAELARKMTDTRPFYVRSAGEIIIGKQNYFSGSVAIVPDSLTGSICSNAIMSFRVTDKASVKFVYELISGNDFLMQREALANGTGQKELSEKEFLNFDVKLPQIIEQQKIAHLLVAIDEKITAEQAKLIAVRQFKKALLQRMVV